MISLLFIDEMMIWNNRAGNDMDMGNIEGRIYKDLMNQAQASKLVLKVCQTNQSLYFISESQLSSYSSPKDFQICVNFNETQAFEYSSKKIK